MVRNMLVTTTGSSALLFSARNKSGRRLTTQTPHISAAVTIHGEIIQTREACEAEEHRTQ
jgi:hypothetical protein